MLAANFLFYILASGICGLEIAYLMHAKILLSGALHANIFNYILNAI